MGQRSKVFMDIRVFDPNAFRYNKQTINQCFAKNENEKKRHYNERILQVDQGSFTPLVFSTTGGMGNECKKLYSRLGELLADKRKTQKSIISSWLATKISFALVRSMLICLRGSRSIKRNFDLDNV